MRITFYGGAGEVGRSCMLLQDGNDELLLDAGAKLGEGEELPAIPDEKIRRIGAIAISHAHLDHIGFLPFMFRKGCRAQIYATKPTRDVTELLLADFLKIREERAARAKRMRFIRDGGSKSRWRQPQDQQQPVGQRHQQSQQSKHREIQRKRHADYGQPHPPQDRQQPANNARQNYARSQQQPNRQQPSREMLPTLAHGQRTQHAQYRPMPAQKRQAQHVHQHPQNRRFGQDETRKHMPQGGNRPFQKPNDVGFGEEDIVKAMKHVRMMEYGQEQRIGQKLRISFHNAGHILGSSTILVKGTKRLLYTADFNLRETMLLDSAKMGLAADALVIESTYGGFHDLIPSVKEARAQFIETINKTLMKGGKVLVPSFAVGRGQEILFVLESHMRSGALQKAPIYVDGMILKANRIYRQNVIYCRDEIQKRILTSDEDPFRSPLFHEPSKSRKEVYREGPAIIVTTSGMMTGGPAVDYFRRLAGDARNKLVLVGYQAVGTLGRKLLEGEKEIPFAEELIRVKMDVKSVSFSAHADHKQLVEFARNVKGLKKVFVVHGDGKKPQELAEDLRKLHLEVIVPKNGETLAV